MTQREYPMAAGETLVSTADLDSIIPYCNPALARISGFMKDELIGQPHNLVRHPDVLEEAFRDLWTTIKSGSTWSACVKNRCKDGDHYWVLANVTPIVRDGRTVGYMSVRTKPSAEQVREAEALDARLRAVAQSGEQVVEGSRTVASAGETMKQIVASVDRVSKLISEIATGTEQQATGIAEVNQAVSQLDSTTQQNAALVEQSAAAAATLIQQSAVLAESVRIFHLR